MRNVAAAAILPKVAVTGQLTAGLRESRFDGMARVDAADVVGIVDEYLPAAGVPVGDLCWVVIEGPALCKTPLDAGADNVFSVGSKVVALTAATSGATTAGRIQAQTINAGTTANASNADMIQNVIGRAMSAATTANSNADLLVDVLRRN